MFHLYLIVHMIMARVVDMSDIQIWPVYSFHKLKYCFCVIDERVGEKSSFDITFPVYLIIASMRITADK